MSFDEILQQALDLLRRQGRVSYRALKRRFDIDDDFLDDLKEELLYVHAANVQADERGFAWMGEAAPSHPAAAETPEAPQPPAERRQLTILFADLVDSTRLSGQLDAEDYRDVVRAYQDACAEVIQRYDGYVAQHLGDGILCYFGFPVSREDEAQRAAHTGLGMLAAIAALNDRLAQAPGVQLAVRVGIHTGLVVIGDIGAGARREQLALSEVPNVAARIQGLAAPNTVVISEATHRLLQGYFDCESLGEQSLRRSWRRCCPCPCRSTAIHC